MWSIAGEPTTVSLDGLPSVLWQEPQLVLAALVVLALLLGGTWLVFQYLRLTPGQEFLRVLAARDSVAVLMHPAPDPDAMSCALAAGTLAESVGTEVTLCYSGQIRRQENRAFETVLDVDFERIENKQDLAGEAVVLVDHNEPRGFDGAEKIDPIAVVDHHPGEGIGREFTDIRTENGACATIFTEYFDQLGWEPVDPDELTTLKNGHKVLRPTTSTALMYGIQSDTKHLTKGCDSSEFQAAAFLYGGIDQDKLDRIADPQVDSEVLDTKARAITEREVRNAFAVSDVGTISNLDAIPQAAGELVRLEGVTAVVVFGDKEGKLTLSGRSRDDRVHMGKALEAVVREIPGSSAGGHARMGGGTISMEGMESTADGMSREEFIDQLFNAMKGDI